MSQEVKTKEVINAPWFRMLMAFGTSCTLLSWYISSMGFFPINLPVQLVGSGVWTYVGWRWKQSSIYLLNGYICLSATMKLISLLT